MLRVSASHDALELKTAFEPNAIGERIYARLG
jgi:hypothetical protein